MTIFLIGSREMTETPASQDRLLALDVMRGATIMGMILVNNPGSWAKMYPPLQHAAWHGWTPTDLIFPFFMFMVGVAMSYSFRKYAVNGNVSATALRKVFQRSAILILLGLLLNGSGQILGLLFGSGAGLSFETLRLPGVLQRIGLGYLGASLIVLYCKPKQQVAIGAVLLFGYAAMLLLLPRGVNPAERLAPEGNVVRVVDLAVLGANHVYTKATTEPTDPEGLLSTLPSIVTVLMGFAVGRFLQRDVATRRKALALLAAGAILAAVGQLWHFVDPAFAGMPINKKLWTSSFVLLTGGLGTIALVACLYVFDMREARSKTLQRVATAFQMVGVNAIFVFVASGIGARLFSMVPLGDSNLKDRYYQTFFIGPLGNNELASLAFSLSVVAFWWLVLWGMWRMRWSIRV